jgi:hypothetical protein
VSWLVAKLNAGGVYTILGATGAVTITVQSINTATTPAVATISISTGSAAPVSPPPTWSQVYGSAAQVQIGDTRSGNTDTDGVNNFGNDAKEVFYRITLATTTTLTVTTCGSTYDTWLR